MPQKTNACGVISLTFSIISIMLSPCCGMGIVFGLIAFILGIIGMKQKNMATGTAIAGLIISIFGCILSIILSILMMGIGGGTLGILEALESMGNAQ